MAEETTTRAVVKIGEKEIKDAIISMTPILAEYQEDNKIINEVLTSAKLAIAQSDELKSCFQTQAGKISLLSALKQAVSLGLSLNPLEGKAALVPIGGKVSYWPMKNGLIELALQTGKVSMISADLVREADHFMITKTDSGDKFEFSPARKDRGEIDGYYAFCRMKDGSSQTYYMTAEEVKSHRERFSGRSKMPEEGYGIKTVLKKLLNNLAIKSDYSDELHYETDERQVPTKGVSAVDLAKRINPENENEDDPS